MLPTRACLRPSTGLLIATCKKGAQKQQKKKTFTKSNLPTKVCEVCGRPMEWRKKWEKVWDQVKYCSDRCRRQRGGGKLDEHAAE